MAVLHLQIVSICGSCERRIDSARRLIPPESYRSNESSQRDRIRLIVQRSGAGRQSFLNSFVEEWFSDHAVSRDRRPQPEANTFGARKETGVDRYHPLIEMHRLRWRFPAAALP